MCIRDRQQDDLQRSDAERISGVELGGIMLTTNLAIVAPVTEADDRAAREAVWQQVTERIVPQTVSYTHLRDGNGVCAGIYRVRRAASFHAAGTDVPDRAVLEFSNCQGTGHSHRCGGQQQKPKALPRSLLQAG